MSEPTTPKSQETQPVRVIDEQTQKHIDRFLQGKDVWNKWANEMLAKKEELEKVGKWKNEEVSLDHDFILSTIDKPSKLKINKWLEETYINFSNIYFLLDDKSITREEIINYDRKYHLQKVESDQIDFSSFIFPGNVNFRNSILDGKANFEQTEFCGYANFDNIECKNSISFSYSNFFSSALFQYANFKNDADFFRSDFAGRVHFRYSKFNKIANFKMSTFHNDVYFSNSKFYGFTQFRDVDFAGRAEFRSVKFRDFTIFNRAYFKWPASFELSQFKDHVVYIEARFYDNLSFELADFEKKANFTEAVFYKAANFEAIYSKRAFSLADAKFTSKIPDFTQANFEESPRLDKIEVLPVPKYISAPNVFGALEWLRYFWKKKFISYVFRIVRRLPLKLFHLIYFPLHYIYKRVQHSCIQFWNTRRNPNEEAHYRALKRLAIQAHDHENEMKFFAGEIRARRHVTDFANFLTHDFASSMRYWAGVAYELFSDFGRSFIRPTLWWFACLWLFANLTLSGAGLQDTTKCHNSRLTPKEAATTIGLKNSLLILGLTKTNIVKQAELCLYGKNKNGEAEREPKPYDPKIKRSYQAKPSKVENTKTDIPFKAAVQGIAHSLLSLLFIFLLLLAIRNQFKIK